MNAEVMAEVATRERAIEIACSFIEKALKELREGDTSRAAVWLDGAIRWIPGGHQ